VALFILGGERLQVPDLETWAHGEPAWDSTPLLSRVRGKKGPGRRLAQRSAAPVVPGD
jgi:hypothetical protein